MKQLITRASELAKSILEHDEVLIVTHIDADGITSGAIAYRSLSRVGIEADIVFVKQLDQQSIDKIKDENKFVWFTDLGSGQINEFDGIEFVITDHHVPVAYHKMQLNPHEFGYDGTVEMSGSVATFLVATFVKRRAGNLFDYEEANTDLSALAIVGAVGDLQDSKSCKLLGLNREVALKAQKLGHINIVRDLRFFGKQTRPVAKMLEYNTDPVIPGITGNERGVLEFLSNLNVDPWKRWIDLPLKDRRKIVSGIVRACVNLHLPYESILRIVGECYLLSREEEGTEKKDANEFSTLLNATARHGKPEIGLKVCLGDEEAFRHARYLLQNHRRILSSGVKLVDEIGIEELEHIQYFHAQDEIPDTVVGIVAGMCFYKANVKKPIIAFAESDNGIKVSARATYELVESGVHLAKAIKKAAELVGGSGGGHSVAAGALIPEGKEGEFLKILDNIIGEQIKS